MPNLVRTNLGAAKRVDSLDGLRCIAILSVILFHYFNRWAPPRALESLYPYGATWAKVSLMEYGGYGVHLFFIISGFVIAMTLNRCRTRTEFFARRYARLAPTMLACSLITLCVETIVPKNPFSPNLLALVSSVTFIDPKILNKVLHTDLFQSVDGAYWSLYVEVRFYILAALIYFANPERFAPILAATVASAVAIQMSQIPLLAGFTMQFLTPQYMPWFVIGVGFFQRLNGGPPSVWVSVITAGVLSLLTIAYAEHSVEAMVAAIVLPAIFSLAVRNYYVGKVLGWWPIASVGAASYSLYLLHQHIGVALLHSLPPFFWAHPMAAVAAAIVLIVTLVLVTGTAFTYLEQPFTRWFTKKLLSRAQIAD